MIILKKGQAGTMQSSDLMVIVEPAPKLTIEIESTVKKQFEHLIRARIEQVLAKFGVTSGLSFAACAIAPRKLPRRFSASVAAEVSSLLPGFWPVPIHSIPCCAAKIARLVSVLSLSPEGEPETVKAAPSLSFHCLVK